MQEFYDNLQKLADVLEHGIDDKVSNEDLMQELCDYLISADFLLDFKLAVIAELAVKFGYDPRQRGETICKFLTDYQLEKQKTKESK